MDNADFESTLVTVRRLMLTTAATSGLRADGLTISERRIGGHFGSARAWNSVLSDGDLDVAAVHVIDVATSVSSAGYRSFADELIARSLDASRATGSSGLRPWFGCVVQCPAVDTAHETAGWAEDVTKLLDRLVAASMLDAAFVLNGASLAMTGRLSIASFRAALQARCLLTSVLAAG